MAKVSKRVWTSPNGEQKSAWVVRHLFGGKHHSKQFEKKRDADAYRLRIETSRHPMLSPKSQTMTLGELARDYLMARQRMCRDGAIATGSLQRESHHIEKGIIPHLGKIPVAHLGVDDVDGLFAKLRATKRVFGGKPLVASSVKKIVQELARILDYGKRRQLVIVNVARDVLAWPEHRKVKSTTIRTFTAEEVKRLLLVVDRRRRCQMERSHVMGRAMIYLAALCGLRFGEIIGLTHDSVDLRRGLLRVRHSLDRWDNHKAPKTASGVRDVPLPAPVAAALRAWLPYSVDNERSLIFVTRAGKRVVGGDFHRDNWHPKLAEAGLGPDEKGRVFHFHALRHFYASLLIESRLSLTDVAQLMGHRTFDQTLMTYAHPIIEVDHRAGVIERMAEDYSAGAITIAQELRAELLTN